MSGFDFEGELARLPEKPGVYIMHSEDDTVIYVGKAKILKNRVRQYFRNNSGHTPKVRAMVSKVAYFEYIITDSEIEALVLECNLIKKYRPKYNILLKDDKQYPYIKVTVNQPYPKLMMTRTLKDDGARYFGPYSGGGTVKNVIGLARSIFKPPTCTRKFPEDIGKGRPCLNYHIKTCFAPCTGRVSQEEYRNVFFAICDFLSGNHKKLLDDLTQQMKDASAKMEYERAADLRDKINAIQRLDEKQKIVNSEHISDLDIIAAAITGDNAFCEVFFVRAGKMMGRENFQLTGASSTPKEEIMSDFLKQFYENAQYIPPEILTDCKASDADVIQDWLCESRGKKVVIHAPVRGEKKKIVDMVLKNAQTAAENYLVSQQRDYQKKNVLYDLAKAAGLSGPPVYIEAYDISNTAGENNVGSMVVFKNGKPARSRYRSFDIKSFEGANDLKAMQEVLYRRFKHAYDEQAQVDEGKLEPEKAKFLPFPDLILIDGGSLHLAAAQEMLDMMSLEIPAFGMVKNDKHRTRALVSKDGELELSPTGSVFKLITSIQDEAHRSAITHHRNKRTKAIKSSELDKIDGVGEKKRAALLKHFKSIKAIAEAGKDELCRAGIDKRTADNIIKYFNRK